MLLKLDQAQEFRPRLGILPEATQHAGGHRLTVDLLHTPHDHAHVGGLDHHAHAHRVDRLLHRRGYLPGHPLLNLQPP